MRQTTGTRKSSGEKLVKGIKRATRKQYSSEEKIRIVLNGLRGEDSIAWKLCTNMRTQDVTDTLDLALGVSGCDQVNVINKPRLLSDKGSSYVSGELADGCTAKA